jgi:serine/threonine-protein kinase RsbW
VIMNGDFELRCPISDDLRLMRELVRTYAEFSGLSGCRPGDLVLAVNEAAINVLEHGGAIGTLTACSDENGVSVEILDSGGTLQGEHLTAEPDMRSLRGLGLWMIRRLCDEVTLDHPDGRSRLCLRMRYADRPPACPPA